MIVLFLRGIKRYTVNALRLDHMRAEYLVLAANYIFLMIYATLESVFVNTLLYRITPAIEVVILYRGIVFVTSAAGMQAAAYMVRKSTPVTVIRLGCVFYLLMYLSLFFGMNCMQVMMYPSAILAGLGGAFYWSGHNTLVTHYTSAWDRDVGISILCVIQGGATLFVPILSGAVISFFYNLLGSVDTGYRVMFGAGMLTTVFQVLYQRRLKPVEQAGRQSEIRLAVRLFRDSLTYRYTVCAEILRGFREGAFGFILNMILFELITSESLVGFNALLTGIASILGAWAYGKLVTPSSRMRYTLVAVTMVFLGCVLMLFFQKAAVVMLYAVINAFFALFILNIASNTTFDVFMQDETARRCLTESLAIREICLTVGRILGLMLFMAFPATLTGELCALLILSFSQYFLAFFIHLTAKELKIRTECDGP